MGQFASKPQRLTQVYEVYMVDGIVSGKRLSIHKRKANNNHKAGPDIKYMGAFSIRDCIFPHNAQDGFL